jgi:high affinity choline transporter 7
MYRVQALLGVAFFYLVIFLVGLFASRNRGQGSTSEVLLAGRRIPLWIGVFTMTATWVDGGYLNGTAEALYGQGLAWAQAPWGFALSLLLGGLFFARVMHENQFTTMLDPFQKRYGDRVGALMYVPAMMGELFWTAGILAALGSTFGVLLHVDVRAAIIVSSAMTIIYTVRGGLWSIAYTDVAQLLMAFFGMVLCVPFVLSHFGSLSELWARYQVQFGSKAAFFPPADALARADWGLATWTWWDSLFLLIFGGIPWHCYFQRVLSSPTARIGQRLSYYAAGCCLVMAVPPAILGMAGAIFDWKGHGLTPPQGAFLILPQVLRDLTPGWVGVAGLCAVAGAIMSSVDASGYSAASMFSWNIYQKLFRPDLTPDQMKRVNRWSIVFIGSLATVVALQVKSIYALWFLCADLVYVLLFPQLLLVLYARRIHSFGVLAGFAVGLVLRLGGGEPALGLAAFIHYPMADGAVWFPFKSVSMLAGLITTMVVSRLPIKSSVAHPVPWLVKSV